MFAATRSLRDSLAKTRQSVFGRIATLLGQNEITEATWDELEATLIQSDLGAALADEIVASLERRAEAEGLVRAEQLKAAPRAELRARLGGAKTLSANAKPGRGRNGAGN